MTKKTTSNKDIPVPESKKVTCMFCKRVDDNYNMTFKYERNGFICENCMHKEMRTGREFKGKFKLGDDY